MFIHNLDPVFLQLGPVQIRYYGLVYAIGFLVAYWLLRWAGKQGKIKNFSASKADDLTLYLIIGLIAGARIFTYIFYMPGELLRAPWEILFLWQGGMSFHGAIVGSVVATYMFCKKNHIRFYQVADLLVVPAALFLFFGRIANFINAELPGTKTDVAWCVVFPGHDGCRHPSQLYEAAKNLLIFFTLLFMQMKLRLKEGTIFWTFVLMYGILRFTINFLRDDPRWLGISMGQWLCIPMIILGAYFLWKVNWGERG